MVTAVRLQRYRSFPLNSCQEFPHPHLQPDTACSTLSGPLHVRPAPGGFPVSWPPHPSARVFYWLSAPPGSLCESCEEDATLCHGGRMTHCRLWGPWGRQLRGEPRYSPMPVQNAVSWPWGRSQPLDDDLRWGWLFSHREDKVAQKTKITFLICALGIQGKTGWQGPDTPGYEAKFNNCKKVAGTKLSLKHGIWRGGVGCVEAFKTLHVIF